MVEQTPTRYRVIPATDNTEPAGSFGASKPDPRKARTPYSLDGFLEALVDLILAITPVGFLAFGCVVYTRHGQPLDQHNNNLLLEIATYVRADFLHLLHNISSACLTYTYLTK